MGCPKTIAAPSSTIPFLFAKGELPQISSAKELYNDKIVSVFARRTSTLLGLKLNFRLGSQGGYPAFSEKEIERHCYKRQTGNGYCESDAENGHQFPQRQAAHRHSRTEGKVIRAHHTPAHLVRYDQLNERKHKGR